MRTRDIILGLIIEFGFLLILGLDTLFFDFKTVPSNYPGDGYLNLSQSIFWHYWIDHCLRFDLNPFGKLIWGSSGIITGILAGEQVRDLQDDHKSTQIMIIITFIYAVLLLLPFLGYEMRYSHRNGSLVVILQSAILLYFPYLFTMIIITLKRSGSIDSYLMNSFASIILVILIILNIFAMLIFNLILCA